MTMSTKEQIEEILKESDAYSLRWEVAYLAKIFMKQDKELTEVQAYQNSYDDWIK